MPLELGIAMARRFMNQPPVHDWTVLVPEGNLYTRVISDLAAYDPPKHDGSLRSAVFAVTKWLCTRENATPLVADVTPVVILDALPAFMTRKHTLEAQWGPDPPWPWLLQAAFAVAKSIN